MCTCMQQRSTGNCVVEKDLSWEYLRCIDCNVHLDLVCLVHTKEVKRPRQRAACQSVQYKYDQIQALMHILYTYTHDHEWSRMLKKIQPVSHVLYQNVQTREYHLSSLLLGKPQTWKPVNEIRFILFHINGAQTRSVYPQVQILRLMPF